MTSHTVSAGWGASVALPSAPNVSLADHEAIWASPVGFGVRVSGGDWTVESTTSLLRRDPWVEVLEEHIKLPDGPPVQQLYPLRLRDFRRVSALPQLGRLVTVKHYRHGSRSETQGLPS